MSPDKRFILFGRRREEPVVINDAATEQQELRQGELRATDPYRYVAVEERENFPVQELVRNPVKTVDQVRAALADAATVRRHKSIGGLQLPEFVDIAAIVLPTAVQERTKKNPHRKELGDAGLEHVLHYALAFQEGGTDLHSSFDALQADFVNGKYIMVNGVYRAAALHVLRVPFAPMYVRGDHH